MGHARRKRLACLSGFALVLWSALSQHHKPQLVVVLTDTCENQAEAGSSGNCQPQLAPENAGLAAWQDKGLVFLVAALSGRKLQKCDAWL
jgi:hypothetical protein